MRFGRVVDFIDFHIGYGIGQLLILLILRLPLVLDCGPTAFCLDRRQTRNDQTINSDSRTCYDSIWALVCSDFAAQLGKKKSKPDEFQVVVRPPLFASGFSDNADNIIEKSENNRGDAQSQTAKLLGANNVENSGFTGLFDFSSVPDDIRTKIDEETYGIQLEKRLPLQILFGGLPDIGPVLDKMAEDSRLRKNRAEGLAPTEGGTKSH